ncbi:MAG: acetate kinase, partial [Bacilli bacterium]|nr:acetate kinase [Bacilli bacterium]
MKLLSINAGSSSLKFRLYEMPAEELLMKGTFERIGLEDSFYTTRMGDDKKEVTTPIKDHKEAVDLLVHIL